MKYLNANMNVYKNNNKTSTTNSVAKLKFILLNGIESLNLLKDCFGCSGILMETDEQHAGSQCMKMNNLH